MFALTPNDIIESSKHLKGNIFTVLFKDAKDNFALKNKTYDTTWIPFNFKKLIKDANGEITIKEVPVKKLCFELVLVASKATPPPKNEGGKPKNMLLMFKKITLDEIRSGDYVPKPKNTNEDTEKEEKRIAELTEELHANTSLFVDALDAIADGFEILCEEIKEKYMSDPDSFKFNMAKESSWVRRDKKGAIIGYEPIIRSIRQNTRKDENNTNNLIPLDVPLFRLKMPVHVGSGKLQLSWKNKSGVEEIRPYIFDARKTSIDMRNNRSKLEPAKIKSNGRLKDIDTENVGDFITYKSIISGFIEFPKLVISKQGLSIVNEFKQLIVKRHRTQTVSETTVQQNSLVKMKGDGSDSDDDNDEEAGEDILNPVLQKNKQVVEKQTSAKVKTEKQTPVEAETDSDSESIVEEVKPTKKNNKKLVKAKQSKKIESESEDSENDSSDEDNISISSS